MTNNQQEIDPKWSPRPDGRYSQVARHDYLAGYSDGFYRYPAGAGHVSPNSCEAYRVGFQHGTDDANAEFDCPADELSAGDMI